MPGMGTTLVLAWFYDNLVTVAHIATPGSTALRGDEFQQITRDHSPAPGTEIDSGLISAEEARYSPEQESGHLALGVDPEVEAEVHDYDVEAGDIYLLCPDGLNDMVEDEEIASDPADPVVKSRLAADRIDPDGK